MPKISVLMSVYNDAPYLEKSIESILHQTFSDFEFVILADAPTDGSAAIIDQFDDPRIVRMRNEKNLGLTASLNRMLSVAQCPYICIHAGDDIALPTRLEKLNEYLDAHSDVGLVSTFKTIIDQAGAVLGHSEPPTKIGEIQQTMLRYNAVQGVYLFRRECLEDAGGGYCEDLLTAQDYDLALRISDRWNLANLPEHLYLVRRHASSITATRNHEQEQNAKIAQQATLERRLTWGRSLLGISRRPLPDWMQEASRGWLAQRYVWWSAGARKHGRGLALQFLIIAMVLDPTTREIWRYISGIIKRKERKLVESIKPARRKRGGS
jgi:glycosyltransferase involved in cell wall biosynthesis